MDACRTGERFERTTILFNHSLVPSKQPELFAEVAARALEKHDVNVLLTRQVEDEALRGRFRALQARFPERLILGNTYSIDDYFRTLWKADIQVSTATHEHLGIATLEAMYAHTCCILPNRCSYPEITGGYGDVLYSSTEELEEKLDYYLANRSAREEAAATLHERSLRYRPEEVASRLMAVLTELADE
jgi:glycosyltransferase involved in cell wall biosynthesis